MHNLHIIRKSLSNRTLSWKLAHDISLFTSRGEIAVVAHNPSAILSSTRRQHLALIRRLQLRKASTLDNDRKLQLARQIEEMQRMTFTAKAPKGWLEADVTFAVAEDFVLVPPVCHITFVTYDFEPEKLHMLTSWMNKDGTVVIYE